MATTISKKPMSMVCVPHGYFTARNLDPVNSSYNESGLEPGIPSATDVDTEHRIHASTSEGISSVYDVDVRIADGGTGAVGGPHAARIIYRDTEASAPGNYWHGWDDFNVVRDVWSINQVDSTSATYYRRPRGCVDADGYIYITYAQDGRVGVNVRSPAGSWTEHKSVSGAAVKDAENRMEPGYRADGDILAVDELDMLYLFYPTLNDDSSEDYVSVGVSISADKGATWRQITDAILPYASANTLANDPEEMRRIRVVYNPVAKTFTLTFEYDDNSHEYIYSTTLTRDFTASDWGESLQYHQLHEVLIDPRTGKEYMLAATDAGGGSITQVALYVKLPGDLYWTATGSTYSYSGLDTASGVSGWIHPDGRPIFLLPDATADTLLALYVSEDDSLVEWGAAISNSALAVNSGLINVSAMWWRDRVILMGNPASGATEELLGIHCGGWGTLPLPAPGDMTLIPSATPSASAGGMTWTHGVSTGATVATNWDAGYLAYDIEADGPTAGGAVSATCNSSLSAVQSTVISMKVEVNSTRPSPDGSIGSRPYVLLSGYTGSQSSTVYLLFSEDGYQTYDLASFSTAVGLDMTAGPVWFLIAYDAAAYEIAIHHSTDGVAFTLGLNLALNHGASATSAKIDYTFGCRTATGTGNSSAYWSLVTVDAESGDTNAQRIISYGGQSSAYTASIDLPGMPISSNPVWVTKGLEVYGSGVSASEGELWELETVATQGVSNALLDGDDSPRIKWVAGASGTQTLVWDTSNEPFILSRGFIYLGNTNGLTGVTFSKDNIGGGSTTLVNEAPTVTLSGAWTRSGNVLYSSASSSAVRWYGRNMLAGSWLTDGSAYRKIASNTPGYWTTETGSAAMRITFEGAASGFSSSGSNLIILPKDLLITYSTSGVGSAATEFTLALLAQAGNAPLEAGKILIGEIFPLPIDPDIGRVRETSHNTERTYGRGMYSRAERLAPAGRSVSFSVRHSNLGTVKYQTQSEVKTTQVGWETSDIYADAHQTVEVLESIAAECGSLTPIVFCGRVDVEPGSADGDQVIPFARETLYGHLAGTSISVTGESGTMWGDEIETLSSYTIRELI